MPHDLGQGQRKCNVALHLAPKLRGRLRGTRDLGAEPPIRRGLGRAIHKARGVPRT